MSSEEPRDDITDEDLVKQFREIYAVDREIIPISRQEDLSAVNMELEAIQKMLLHVYEFGNFEDPIKKWKEVYGLLIGKIDNGKLTIMNAAPITHGTSRGVEFKKKDYIYAAKINDMLINDGRDEFFVGWYHSHPAIGLFLSQVDLVNQLGYQMVNQVAVAIVFDHCLLIENKIPFKVFRLDATDFNLPEDLGYHIVDYDIIGLEKSEEIDYMREVHDEIGKELKNASFKSAEKLFRKELEDKYKEFEKQAKKEKIKYEKTNYKELKKSKKTKTEKKKETKKKKVKKKKKIKKEKKEEIKPEVEDLQTEKKPEKKKKSKPKRKAKVKKKKTKIKKKKAKGKKITKSTLRKIEKKVDKEVEKEKKRIEKELKEKEKQRLKDQKQLEKEREEEEKIMKKIEEEVEKEFLEKSKSSRKRRRKS